MRYYQYKTVRPNAVPAVPIYNRDNKPFFTIFLLLLFYYLYYFRKILYSIVFKKNSRIQLKYSKI